jgi:competence protein ComEC
MELLHQLRKNPFFRILIPYILGLLIGYHFFPTNLIGILLFILLLLTVFFIFLHALSLVKYNYTWVYGAIIMLMFCFAGMANVLVKQYILNRQQLNNGNINTCRLLITDRPEIKSKWISFPVVIKEIMYHEKPVHSAINAILRLRASAESEKLKAGDIIVIKVRFASFYTPGNPGEFNYSQYMLRQNIPCQLYAVGQQIIYAGHTYRNLKIIAAICRDYLVRTLTSGQTDSRKASVLSALTLGYKNGLEADTVDIFTRAGVVHIMALSGFNVGLIFIMVNFILKLLGNKKRANILRWFITLMAVWFFALITGLSPSVTRAATMISIVVTARLIDRHASPLNIIAASAFIILVFKPLQLFNVGFQLSYAAVAGIIYFQPFFYKLLIFKSVIIDKIWNLFTLSVAAQLATAPLVLYYFHQFPLLFWITNIYVVPLVCAIIYTSGLLFLLSFIHPVSILLNRLLEILTDALLWPLDQLTDFSWIVADGIYLSRIQIFILLYLLAILAIYLYYPGKKILWQALLMILVFLLLNICNIFQVKNQQYFIVNKMRNASAFNFVSGTQNLLFTATGSSLSGRTINYHFRNWWIRHRIYKNAEIIKTNQINARQISSHLNIPCYDNMLGSNIFFNFEGISVVICTDDCFNNLHGSLSFKVNYLIITDAIKPQINNLLKCFEADMVIIDSSVDFYKAKKWAEQCRRANINYWNINESGAFVVDLNKRKKESL